MRGDNCSSASYRSCSKKHIYSQKNLFDLYNYIIVNNTLGHNCILNVPHILTEIHFNLVTHR